MNKKNKSTLTKEELELWLKTAKREAKNSHDPNTKVGAVIIGIDGKGKSHVIGFGSNMFPPFGKLSYPVKRKAEHRKDTKYPYIIHAEMKALFSMLAIPVSMQKRCIFSTHLPCTDCLKHLALFGISAVFFEKVGNMGKDEIETVQHACVLHGIALFQIGRVKEEKEEKVKEEKEEKTENQKNRKREIIWK